MPLSARQPRGCIKLHCRPKLFVAEMVFFLENSLWIRRCPFSSCIVRLWLSVLVRICLPSCLCQVTVGCGEPRATQWRVIFSPTLAVMSTGASENNGPAVRRGVDFPLCIFCEKNKLHVENWSVGSPPTSRLTVPAEVPAGLLATQVYWPASTSWTPRIWSVPRFTSCSTKGAEPTSSSPGKKWDSSVTIYSPPCRWRVRCSFVVHQTGTLHVKRHFLHPGAMLLSHLHCFIFITIAVCPIFWAYIFLFYIVGILWTAKEKFDCTEKHVFSLCIWQ